MVVSLSNKKRIKKRKAPPAKKNATTGPNKRMLAPVRQRRGRYADTTSRTNTGDGMALLNAVRSKENLKRSTTNRKKQLEIWRCGWAKRRRHYDTNSTGTESKGMVTSEWEQCHRPFPYITLITTTALHNKHRSRMLICQVPPLCPHRARWAPCLPPSQELSKSRHSESLVLKLRWKSTLLHRVISLANGQAPRPLHNRPIAELVSVMVITNSPLR